MGGSVGRDTATVTMTDTDIVIAFENAQRKAAHEWAPPVPGRAQKLSGL